MTWRLLTDLEHLGSLSIKVVTSHNVETIIQRKKSEAIRNR